MRVCGYPKLQLPSDRVFVIKSRLLLSICNSFQAVVVCLFVTSFGNTALAEVRVVALKSGDVSWWHPLVAGPRLDVLLAVHEIYILKAESPRFE